MSRYQPQACDHRDCLRPAVEKVYFPTTPRFEYLCEKHLPPVEFNNPSGQTP